MTLSPTYNPFISAKLFTRRSAMAFQSEIPRGASERSRTDVWEYRLVFTGTFIAMLVVALFSRCCVSHWRANSGVGAHKSIFHEAKARTDQIAPFVFMG
jgi:hypothetical protein